MSSISQHNAAAFRPSPPSKLISSEPIIDLPPSEDNENFDFEEDEDAEFADELQQQKQSLLLHKTVDLLSAHKLAIAEMVEVMKDEMGLVQDMESATDRDSEKYAEVLNNILNVKYESIKTLQNQLELFKSYRRSTALSGSN